LPEPYLYLADILPTAYQAVAYADVPDGGTLAVLGLGPVGQMAVRNARHLGVQRVIGVDPVPERRAATERFGVQTLDPGAVDNTAAALTGGRGPDAVIDTVGMEAHGHDEPRSTRLIAAGQKATGLLPDSVAEKVSDQAVGDDRDPLGVREFATHHLPLEDAPRGYEIFRDKAEGCIKVVLQP
jgi:threonine dehydrogenase-like Zn-dependent dehydrogenase